MSLYKYILSPISEPSPPEHIKHVHVDEVLHVVAAAAFAVAVGPALVIAAVRAPLRV